MTIVRSPISQRRLGHLGRGALMALTLGLGFAVVTPALAADDGEGSMFGTILSTVTGVGKAKDVELPVEYRERAPLVVPPNKADLPPPLPSAAARNPAWPKDPDVEAARKAAALGRAPAPMPVNGIEDKLSREELAKGRIASKGATAPVPMGCDSLLDRSCGGETPEHFWNVMKTSKGESKEVALQPGQEPPREYLTQPPKGYLAPRKVAKYSFDSPSGNFKDDTLGDAAGYTREQNRKKTSVDE